MNYRLISCLCGGFLLAVLWFDLMHDVAIYPYLGGEGLVASDALLTVQTYYRRVLVDSSPMSSLVALVMVLAIGVNLVRLMKSREPVWLRIGCLLLLLPPTLWALTGIVPMAKRVAEEGTDPAILSSLASQIFHAHVICLVMITGFILLQFFPTRRG